MNKGTLYIISAPSGAGKTSLVAALIQAVPNIFVSISHTTREMRANEIKEKDYNFVSKAEFKELLSKNVFLEYAQVFGNFYGTSRQWVEETLEQGKDVILEIDWQGARQVRTHYSEAQSIFIFPPSQEALLDRLKKRHPDNATLVQERIKEAKQELSRYYEYDYLICNDKFEQALDDLKMIVLSQRLRIKPQMLIQEGLIKKLLE
jgi:guanylate kinase